MWYVKLQFLFNNISVSLIFLFDPASSEKIFSLQKHDINFRFRRAKNFTIKVGSILHFVGIKIYYF